MTASLHSELAADVGGRHVIIEPDGRVPFETDWTGEYRGVASAVVLPATMAEVAAVVATCRRLGCPITIQGGNTGLVGGSVPDGTGTCVVLSTRRLIAAGPVDRVGRQATFGAGVTLAAARAHAGAAGLDVGVDLAARDTATIGGMAATNAGGVHVLRHGTMRRQVVGYEAVLADGAVVSHLGGLEKDNTGYDLGGVLCGSEGTLAVITALRLRLVPIPAFRTTALLAWPDLDAMTRGFEVLRARLDGLQAAEYMVRAGVELVCRRFDVPDPFDRPHAAYLLVEAAGRDDPLAPLAAATAAAEDLSDAAVASTAAQAAALWAIRERHTDALAAAGPPRKYDVSVPVRSIPRFVGAVSALAAEFGATCHHFGHLGDGNVHVNLLTVAGAGPAELTRLDGAVLGLVSDHEGSISAEHGIGRFKRDWLHLSRSPAELAAFAAVKSALDPDGRLNPGVLLPEPRPRTG